jgi:hypothetical protein
MAPSKEHIYELLLYGRRSHQEFSGVAGHTEYVL